MVSQEPRCRPAPSLGEEIANAVTHGVGWLLSAAGLSLLVTFAAIHRGPLEIVSSAVFGASLVILYGASTLYHALPGDRAKRVLRVLDHAAIYILIAGTYTPIALSLIGGTKGWVLFSCVWSLALFGLFVTFRRVRGARFFEMTLYLVMGWMVVAVGGALWRSMPPVPFRLVVAGGLAYTGGLVFYGWKKLPYSHMIWHLFVLAGSVLHFLAILLSFAGPSN